MISAPSYRELELFDTIQYNESKLFDLSFKYFTSPNDISIDPKGSKIIEFFKNKHVFLTGGTGFVGILTVEKLLRACPDIGCIYLLMRNKKNKDVQQRVQEYFQNEIFKELSKMRPNFKNKVRIISGDVALADLGISAEDRQLLTKNVQVIIHGAATVNFDAKFRIAMTVNVKGTCEMLKLAKECPKLVSYIHISTAYSSPEWRHIKEDVNEYTENIDDIFDLVERHLDVELEDISKKLRKDFPNNYSFSKHIAECITKRHMDQMPISIFRPSMIISTYKEPLRGWTNNIYGPLAITLAVGIGLQHIILSKPKTQGDMVPADYVVNGLIAVCYKNSITRKQVYNFVSRPCVLISWQDLVRSCERSYHECGACSIKTLTPLFILTLTTNRWFFNLFAFLLHTVPAAILDTLAKLTGQQEKITVSDAVQKLHKVTDLVLYYNKRQWKFDYHNVDNLWKELSEADRNAFPFNVREVSWKIHIISILFGLRTYIVKESISTLPVARIRLKKLHLIFYTIMGIIFFLLFIIVNYFYNTTLYYMFG